MRLLAAAITTAGQANKCIKVVQLQQDKAQSLWIKYKKAIQWEWKTAFPENLDSQCLLKKLVIFRHNLAHTAAKALLLYKIVNKNDGVCI